MLLNLRRFQALERLSRIKVILYVRRRWKISFFEGKLYELTNNGPVDVAGKILVDKQFYKSEMIVYPAKMKKHVVPVFMDITCHYCHLLHQQLKNITILALPYVIWLSLVQV